MFFLVLGVFLIEDHHFSFVFVSLLAFQRLVLMMCLCCLIKRLEVNKKWVSMINKKKDLPAFDAELDDECIAW